MAASAVVLCNPLCFLANKFGRTATRPLKSMVLDFYDVGVLSDAKCQLLDDIRGLNLDIDMPHVPERRDSGNKAMYIVDDIFTLLTFLDENLKLTLLPRYVADNPDALPSSRLYEGDLSVLMNLIEKMQKEIKELNIALASLARDVKQGSKCFSSVQSTLPVVNNDRSLTGQPGIPVRHSVDSEMTSRNLVRQPGDPHSGILNTAETQPRMDWASVAVTSSPIVHGSRFSVLASADDDERDAQPFTEYRSRRSIKRQRQASNQSQLSRSQQPPQQSADQQRTTQRRQRGNRLMTGNSLSVVHGLSAAKKVTSKAVFCVDNLDPSVDVNDLRDFVRQLSVNVLTCFRVQPRRQRNESGPVVDRVAFRLCIDAAHQDKLLDCSKWPDSVTVSKWYHIAPSQDRIHPNRGQQGRPVDGLQVSDNHSETLPKTATTVSSVEAAAGCPSTMSDAVVGTIDAEPTTAETTVIYNDGAFTATTNST